MIGLVGVWAETQFDGSTAQSLLHRLQMKSPYQMNIYEYFDPDAECGIRTDAVMLLVS